MNHPSRATPVRVYSRGRELTLALLLPWLTGLVSCERETARSFSIRDPLSKGPPIRINIADISRADLPATVDLTVEFEVDGDLRIFSLPDPVLLREIGGRRFELHFRGDRTLLRDEAFGPQVRLAGSRGETFRVRWSGSGNEGRFAEYRGVLDLFNYGGESLRLVNELSLEEYLAGVLGGEMGGDAFGLDALRAQAVVARTYTLYNLKRVLDVQGALPPDHAFPKNTDFQSYGGVGSEASKILQAIRDTRGEVLSFEGKLFQTYYHSTCGGHTAPGTLFGEQPIQPLAGVPCGYCENAPGYAWTESLPAADLEEVLRSWAEARGVAMGALVSLGTVDRGTSRHCVYFKVSHSQGSFEIRSDHLRRLVRDYLHGNVRSSNVDVEISRRGGAGDTVNFRGFGHGHGVGLCQYGAAKLAETRDYGQILAHYFPRAGMKRVY